VKKENPDDGVHYEAVGGYNREADCGDDPIPVRMTRDIAVIQRKITVRNHHKPFPVRK
jgi:hypothetical protein